MEPELVHAAVTSDGRDIDFYPTSKLLSSSTFDREAKGASIAVNSDAINELIERHNPTVIVMDVEGGEAELIPAADLSRVRALIVEIHPDVLSAECIDSLLTTIEAKGLGLVEKRDWAYLFSR